MVGEDRRDLPIEELLSSWAPAPQTPAAPPQPIPKPYEPDPEWLAHQWDRLSDRDQNVLVQRQAGHTLEEIGTGLGLTREAVRQIQKRSYASLQEAMELDDPGLRGRLATTLGDRPAVAHLELAVGLPPGTHAAQTSLLGVLGIANPQTWDGPLRDFWTRMPDALDRQIRRLVEMAPILDADLDGILAELGLMLGDAAIGLLNSPNSKLRHHSLGWYRPGRSGRDLAYLYLQSEGEPRPAGDVAQVTGTSEHAIRETMRRDEEFAQVRPEGTWCLADWRLPGADNRYSNAEEAVVEVLREMGPLTVDELRVEAQRRYPVSSWRITQCLSAAAIGRTADGRYDLAERGAVPVEDTEPKRPANMNVQGDLVGVTLDVSYDVMRGSGVPVNRWLTWYLGLRVSPSIRRFEMTEPPGELTVKRATSNAQISSLRTAVQALDLVEGCKIALVLNTTESTAWIRHVCRASDCSA